MINIAITSAIIGTINIGIISIIIITTIIMP